MLPEVKVIQGSDLTLLRALLGVDRIPGVLLEKKEGLDWMTDKLELL